MTILVNKGSDLNFKITWPEGTGRKNLTGYNVSLYDYSPGLQQYLTLTISNPTQGEITGRLGWHDSFVSKKAMSFRIMIDSGTDVTTTPPVRIEVI